MSPVQHSSIMFRAL